MAPELHLKMPYSGNSIDLFASGIILFIMMNGHPPFHKADPRDSLYKLICTNKHEHFWKFHEKTYKTTFSDSFKKLINSMLAFDPTQRLSLGEIIAHEWMKGVMKNEEEIIFEFNERKKTIHDRKKKFSFQNSKNNNEISLKNTKFYQIPLDCKKFRCDQRASIMVKLKKLCLETREIYNIQVYSF